MFGTWFALVLWWSNSGVLVGYYPNVEACEKAAQATVRKWSDGEAVTFGKGQYACTEVHIRVGQ